MIIQNQNSDFYYWYDETPNDWESAFRGSLWEYDEVRGQYYLHTFAKEQADLKWDNPVVRRAMKYESSSAQRLICTSHSEASSAQQELLPTLTSMLEWKEQWLLILTSSSIFDKETEQSLLWKEW